MYYRHNNIEISYPFTIKPDEQAPDTWFVVKNAGWFSDNTDAELAGWGITRHDDPVIPDHDSATHKLRKLPSGEYEIVELTQAELAEKAARVRQQLDAIEISRFQAKASLLQAGLLDQVESFIEQSADPLVKLAWSEAGFKRGSNMVNSIGQQLGLSTQQLDDLFISGQQIEV